ncbi:MAG: cell division ATP-binding protein FtsE, partial [Candidatus Limnocylindrus sp.]
PREEVDAAVERALRIVGLTALAERYPDALSGGEQQRAAIARAIVGNPELLIADEPTGNLDPLISWEIMELLGQINQLGVTVLVATHDSDVVTTLRKRVIGLEGGRLIRDEARGTYHRAG